MKHVLALSKFITFAFKIRFTVIFVVFFLCEFSWPEYHFCRERLVLLEVLSSKAIYMTSVTSSAHSSMFLRLTFSLTSRPTSFYTCFVSRLRDLDPITFNQHPSDDVSFFPHGRCQSTQGNRLLQKWWCDGHWFSNFHAFSTLEFSNNVDWCNSYIYRWLTIVKMCSNIVRFVSYTNKYNLEIKLFTTRLCILIEPYGNRALKSPIMITGPFNLSRIASDSNMCISIASRFWVWLYFLIMTKWTDPPECLTLL